MAMTKPQTARRRPREAPELLIAYLQYALADVRALSDRGAQHLEKTIEMLTEDTSLIDLAEPAMARQRTS